MITVDVSILIVSYNTRAWLRRCLQSVYRETHDVSFEVIVVDNASLDGSAELVRTEFPAVRLVASQENLGFAKGVNVGAEMASAEYLMLLNPDAMVHDRAVDQLYRFATTNPQHGIYGGRTLALDGAVDPRSCWALPTPWSMFCFGLGLSTIFRQSRLFDPESLGCWNRDSVREVGVVSGSVLLVPQKLWRALGGFNPAFFMYGEDADLCARAAALGYRPAVTPDAVVTHAVGASSSAHADKMTLVMKGKSTFLRRHWPPLQRRFGLSMLVLGAAVRAATGSMLERLGHRRARRSAWQEVWRRRADWLPGYVPET